MYIISRIGKSKSRCVMHLLLFYLCRNSSGLWLPSKKGEIYMTEISTQIQKNIDAYKALFADCADIKMREMMLGSAFWHILRLRYLISLWKIPLWGS